MSGSNPFNITGLLNGGRTLRRSVFRRTAFQNLSRKALLKLAHRPHLMTAEIAADDGIIVATLSEVESVSAALGTIQLDAQLNPTQTHQ